MESNHEMSTPKKTVSESYQTSPELKEALRESVPPGYKIRQVWECMVKRWVSLTPEDRIRELCGASETPEARIRRIAREEIAAAAKPHRGRSGGRADRTGGG